MAVTTVPGRLPHVEWIDLKSNGIMIECAIVKRDAFGNIYFFEIPALDRIDKGRLTRILHDRNVKNFELWDLLGQKTLNNGVNALEYFHQLVKVLTPGGQIINPKSGQIGVNLRSTQGGVVKVAPPAEATQPAATN